MRSWARPGRVVVVAIAAVALAGCGWPQFMGDASHSGFNPGEQALGVDNADDLHVAWSVDKDPAAFGASPVVANGVVYIGSLSNTNSAHLYAFDAQTGAQRWRVGTGQISNAVAVVDGTVYASEDDGQVHTYDASTGAPGWTSSYEWGQNVTVAGGAVYGTFGSAVIAIDAATGQRRWTYGPMGDDQDSYDHTSTAYADGVVYALGFQRLHALDAATGALRWSVAPGGRIGGPSVVDGRVYYGAYLSPALVAVDATTGAPHWSHTIGHPVLTTPAVAGDVVYAGSENEGARPRGRFYALNATNGHELWHFAPDGGTWLGSAAVANGVVYDPGTGGLEARDATTGALLKNVNLGCGNNPSSPAVVHGHVYVACASTLYAFDAS
jgi:outer membrane protein assembly factor BamB